MFSIALILTCFDEDDNYFNLKYMFIRRLYCFVLIFIINKCIYLFDKRPNIETDDKLLSGRILHIKVADL